jgi:hypothetical protein
MLDLIFSYGFEVLTSDNETDLLADSYIKAKIVPQRSREDARHIALASTNNIDYLVSLNFKHITKSRTQIGVDVV